MDESDKSVQQSNSVNSPLSLCLFNINENMQYFIYFMLSYCDGQFMTFSPFVTV